ncbi:SCND3 protein, partial [Amia calva]|nr:SCND3 protein [Amia calva]
MEEEPRPQCVVCGDVLSNESIKPMHALYLLEDKPVDFFLRKRDELKQSKSTIQSCVTPPRRIGAMADDVKNTLIERIKSSGVCTDGTRAMTGRHNRVATRIHEVATEMRWTHCSIRHEALAVKKMPEELKSVLDSAVKTVNFIKGRLLLTSPSRSPWNPSSSAKNLGVNAQPMHSRLSHGLCDEMGSEHVQLLLHTEVRWLSRGKALLRLFELHREVQTFLEEKNFPLSYVFEDTVWLRQLAYLSDQLSCDKTLKSAIRSQSLLDFWIQQHSEYPALSYKAMLFLLPFATTYLCDKGFSSLAVIKTKYRRRMDAEPNLRLKLTSTDPDITGLCSQRKAHTPHIRLM